MVARRVNRKLEAVDSVQASEIEAQRRATHRTRRNTSRALEEILFLPVPVLDHGFIRVIDYMGDDAAIVQAARVSYGAGTKQYRDDAALINYLMRNRHTSPFEMCEIKLHVKLPIFVARQWIRHRTASVNEYSARYSVLEREFYAPARDQVAAQSLNNRQGRGHALSGEVADRVIQLLVEDAERAYEDYERLLRGLDEPTSKTTATGLARELARINLTLGYYTQWYWKIDLHNLLHFVELRASPHAQHEIRVYAEAILDVLRRWVPITHAAFVENRLQSLSLSASAVRAVTAMLAGETIDDPPPGVASSEWREVKLRFGLASGD